MVTASQQPARITGRGRVVPNAARSGTHTIVRTARTAAVRRAKPGPWRDSRNIPAAAARAAVDAWVTGGWPGANPGLGRERRPIPAAAARAAGTAWVPGW